MAFTIGILHITAFCAFISWITGEGSLYHWEFLSAFIAYTNDGFRPVFSGCVQCELAKVTFKSYHFYFMDHIDDTLKIHDCPYKFIYSKSSCTVLMCSLEVQL